MTQIIRGGEAGLQLPGRRSAWGDFNTPDPTGDLIKNINQRKQDFKDFYSTQKDEIEELNKALEGMQGEDFKHMQTKIIDTRNQIAKLYSTANKKNYNSPEFQAKLYSIKDDFVKLKSTIETSAGNLAQAKTYADTQKYVVRDAATAYLKQQAMLPPDQRDKNPLNTVQTDPRFFNPYAAVEGVVKELGKEAEHAYDIQDGPFNRTVKKKYNTALYEVDPKTNQPVFRVADDVVDNLLQDPRMVTQALNWIPADKAKLVVGNGNDDMNKDLLKEELKKFITQQEMLKERYTPSTTEVRVSKENQPSAAGLRREEEEKANLQLYKNAQLNPDSIADAYALGNIQDEGPIAMTPSKDGDGNVVGYEVTFRKKNPDQIGKITKTFVDEKKFYSIKSFGDRETFFNQVVNPYEDKRNTRKQKGDVSPVSTVKSDGKDVKSWKPENQYEVRGSIYYYDQADKKWKKK